jgi:ParB-like chromosome segregation protein Spo0J
MEYHNLTKAQLARKLNISRARVTQMLNLLKLPDDLIQEVEEVGDKWERRLVTERMLRGKIIVAQSEIQSDLNSAGN